MTLVTRSSAGPAVGMPTRPRGRLRAEDTVGFLAANVVLIVLMWVRHGGLERIPELIPRALPITATD